jgi:release factor glutamine methyltransferase
VISAAEVERRLAAAGCIAADAEARELLAEAPDDGTLESWIARRETGEPLAWIVGATTFCGLRLRVDRGVFVPRPQTEELARRAARLVPPGGFLADLCTGCGAVAAAVAALANARVVGADLDPVAARCAATNGVPTVVADLGASFADRAFDVVAAVAPYVPTDELRLLPADVQRFEPRDALDGGRDGLRVLRRLVDDARRILRSGGWLLTEIGGEQDAAIQPLLRDAGFAAVESWRDEEGAVRGIGARRRQYWREIV